MKCSDDCLSVGEFEEPGNNLPCAGLLSGVVANSIGDGGGSYNLGLWETTKNRGPCLKNKQTEE